VLVKFIVVGMRGAGGGVGGSRRGEVGEEDAEKRFRRKFFPRGWPAKVRKAKDRSENFPTVCGKFPLLCGSWLAMLQRSF
jgi:hypothetical protein